MAFCPNCGSQVDGRFCAKCGAAVAADAGTGGTVPPPPAAQAAGLQENVASALCYLLGLLTGILFLVLAPYNQNKTIRFHAFQAIFAHLAVIVAFIVINILVGALSLFGGFFAIALWPILSLACLCGWVFLMYKAYNNEKIVLPVIGPLAEKQAG
jgi:uncharacterized membrane protein